MSKSVLISAARSASGSILSVLLLTSAWTVRADAPVETARMIPAARAAMKVMLEDMKLRPYRIPLPPLTEAQKQTGSREGNTYEARLRQLYIPSEEGSVFGRGTPRTATPPAEPVRRPADFTRNTDPAMTLSYQFKTQLFWIVSRTNNCQYCLGHQEWKLSATGMTDDEIAALDSDWEKYGPAEQAAFQYARLLTYQPDRLSDESIRSLEQFYTPQQILEMTMSVSGNNAINRWKEGTGIPQSAENTFNRTTPASNDSASKSHGSSFVTSTSEKYQQAVSVVAPLEIKDGQPTGRGMSLRPAMETKDEVLQTLNALTTRPPRIPSGEKSVAESLLHELKMDVPVNHWVQLLSQFPVDAKLRIPPLLAREKQTGVLTELQKARICWILARQDRAWYAAGRARQHLHALGLSDDQIFALDGDLSEFSETERSLMTAARNLAASPIAMTDEDAASVLRHHGPAHLVQLINLVASCAYFNRVTEAAGLPTDPAFP